METAKLHSVRRWELGRICVQDAVYPPLHQMAPHTDGRSRISILVAGAVEETSDAVTHWATPGSTVIKPACSVHGNRFGPFGARILSVTPDCGWLKEISGVPNLVEAQYRWCHGIEHLSLAQAIRQTITRPNKHEIAALEQLVATLVQQTSDRPMRSRPPAWLAKVSAKLQSNISQPPCVSRLAEDAGVHVVYLARAFRRYYRCTIADYVRRLRVLNAAYMLTNGRLPLAQIALEVGFSDQPHFCRQFRRETGTTPNAYRLTSSGRQVSFVQS